MMRDGYRRRHEDAVDPLTLYQLARHAALEPSHFGELVLVGLDGAAFGFGEASDHQRRRKRPRLRRVVSYLADFYRRFFHQLASHGFLDRFAGLDEAGERGEHAGRKLFAASDQAGFALGREHDDDGIDARKMFGVALGAEAAIAGVHHFRGLAASRTEAVALMPIDHRLRLPDDRRALDRHERGGHARVAEETVSRERSGFRGILGLRNIEREDCAVAVEAEEDACGAVSCERVRRYGIDEAEIEWRRGAFGAGQKRLQLPHWKHQR